MSVNGKADIRVWMWTCSESSRGKSAWDGARTKSNPPEETSGGVGCEKGQLYQKETTKPRAIPRADSRPLLRAAATLGTRIPVTRSSLAYTAGARIDTGLHSDPVRRQVPVSHPGAPCVFSRFRPGQPQIHVECLGLDLRQFLQQPQLLLG